MASIDMETLRRACELSEAVRTVRAMVSEKQWFDRFPGERDRAAIPEKLKEGRPLLEPDLLEITPAAAERVSESLLRVFTEHLAERTEDWRRLAQETNGGGLGARELLQATLHHRGDVLRVWAGRLGLDLDALQFFSIYVARPFRQEAAEYLWDGTHADLWQRGYCPVCGHRPVLGRLVGAPGHRRLWCCCCNTAWSFPRIGCPFCRNEAPDQLGYLTLDEFTSYRIYVCDRCKRYLKTRVCPEESSKDNGDYDRDYFSTAALDSVALREGYIAEPVWLAHDQSSVGSSQFPVDGEP